MPAIAIAVVAYLAFGVTGMGVAVLLIAAATLAALAFGPTPDDVAAVIVAIEATYPESSSHRIVDHLNPGTAGPDFPMAKVYAILEALEDEGTVESFTVQGRNHRARRGRARAPMLFWRVVRARPRKRLRASPRSLLPRFGASVPA